MFYCVCGEGLRKFLVHGRERKIVTVSVSIYVVLSRVKSFVASPESLYPSYQSLPFFWRYS